MNEFEARRSIASDYVAALLRSRAAVDRILACVADVAERDAECARVLAAHPEAVAALSRAATPAPWLLRAAIERPAGGRRAAAPYLTAGRIAKTRRRKH